MTDMTNSRSTIQEVFKENLVTLKDGQPIIQMPSQVQIAFKVVVSGERFNQTFKQWKGFSITTNIVAKNRFAAIGKAYTLHSYMQSENFRNVTITCNEVTKKLHI